MSMTSGMMPEDGRDDSAPGISAFEHWLLCNSRRVTIIACAMFWTAVALLIVYL
jgi:hypothetical protein